MIHALHLPFIPALLIAIAAMALKDLLGTLMTVAEARGASKLAGHTDALGDGAQIACQVVGAGSIILTGINLHSLIIIAAIMITSDLGTRLWTRYAKEHVPADPRLADLEQRLAALEQICAASSETTNGGQ